MKQKPYVWLFQLGQGAKVGAKLVPSTYAEAPCYKYRLDASKHAAALNAIDEPNVPKAALNVTMAAIEAFAEALSLSTDREESEDADEAETLYGFHAAATFEEAGPRSSAAASWSSRPPKSSRRR